MSLEYRSLPHLFLFEVFEGVVVRSWHELSPISNDRGEGDSLGSFEFQSWAIRDSGNEGLFNFVGSRSRQFGLFDLPFLGSGFFVFILGH